MSKTTTIPTVDAKTTSRTKATSKEAPLEDRMREAEALAESRQEALHEARQAHADMVSDSGTDDSITPTMLTDAAAGITIAEQRLKAAQMAVRGLQSEARREVDKRLGMAVADTLQAAVGMPVSFGPLPSDVAWGLEVSAASGTEDTTWGVLKGTATITTKRPAGLGPITAGLLRDVWPEHMVKIEQRDELVHVTGSFREAVPTVLPAVVEGGADDAVRQLSHAVGSFYGMVFNTYDRLGNPVPRLFVNALNHSVRDGGVDLATGVRSVVLTATLLGRTDDPISPLPMGEVEALAAGIDALVGLYTTIGRVTEVKVLRNGTHASAGRELRPPHPTATVELVVVSKAPVGH